MTGMMMTEKWVNTVLLHFWKARPLLEGKHGQRGCLQACGCTFILLDKAAMSSSQDDQHAYLSGQQYRRFCRTLVSPPSSLSRQACAHTLLVMLLAVAPSSDLNLISGMISC